MNQKQQAATYNIPLKYRKMENLHIVFWLFKDVAWCMVWKPLGIIMIIPTLAISIIIAWRTRQYMSELCHNLAISIWISANSYWMISEFLGFDTIPIQGGLTMKHFRVCHVISFLLRHYQFSLVSWRPIVPICRRIPASMWQQHS